MRIGLDSHMSPVAGNRMFKSPLLGVALGKATCSRTHPSHDRFVVASGARQRLHLLSEGHVPH
jgi:hypothetical protein